MFVNGVNALGYGQNKTYETNLRAYFCRPGCSRPVRGPCVCRAGGRTCFGASRHHGLRPDPPATLSHHGVVGGAVAVVLGLIVDYLRGCWRNGINMNGSCGC